MIIKIYKKKKMIKEKMESTFNYKEGNGKNFIYSYYKFHQMDNIIIYGVKN